MYRQPKVVYGGKFGVVSQDTVLSRAPPKNSTISPDSLREVVQPDYGSTMLPGLLGKIGARLPPGCPRYLYYDLLIMLDAMRHATLFAQKRREGGVYCTWAGYENYRERFSAIAQTGNEVT